MPTQPQARPALQPSKNGGSVSGYHELMTSLTAQWSRLLSGGQAAELYFHTSPTASRTHYSAAMRCAARVPIVQLRIPAGRPAEQWRAPEGNDARRSRGHGTSALTLMPRLGCCLYRFTDHPKGLIPVVPSAVKIPTAPSATPRPSLSTIKRPTNSLTRPSPHSTGMS